MNKIIQIFEWISYWILKLWYLIILVSSTWYVKCNFESIKEFTFFDKFNGDNLIFILWLALLLLPLFDSFEGFGISIKRRKEEEVIDKSNEAATAASNIENISDWQELEKEFKEKKGKEARHDK